MGRMKQTARKSTCGGVILKTKPTHKQLKTKATHINNDAMADADKVLNANLKATLSGDECVFLKLDLCPFLNSICNFSEAVNSNCNKEAYQKHSVTDPSAQAEGSESTTQMRGDGGVTSGQNGNQVNSGHMIKENYTTICVSLSFLNYAIIPSCKC